MSSNRKLLSFIVPAFNTGDLLFNCIMSILSQTYDNFECIIVNDGSTDNTAEICEHFKSIDSRVRVISKNNEGLSVARNIAVKEAKGYYLMFVDSDDRLVDRTAEIMINLIEKTSVDAAMCRYFSSEMPPKLVSEHLDYELMNAHELCDRILRDEIGSQLWQFMFLKDQWNGVVSPPGRYAQDMAVLHKVIDKMNNVVVLNEYLYYYYISRADSTSNSKSHKTKGRLDRAYAFWQRIQFAEERGYLNAVEDILSKAVAFSVRALSERDSLDEKYADDIKMIQYCIRKNLRSINKNKKIDNRKKAAAFFIMIFPRMYIKIRSLFHSNSSKE